MYIVLGFISVLQILSFVAFICLSFGEMYYLFGLWALVPILLTIIFRFIFVVIILAFFGAIDLLGLHWSFALLLLVTLFLMMFVIPFTLVGYLETQERNKGSER